LFIGQKRFQKPKGETAMCYKKIVRPARLLLAGVVAMLTCAVVAPAVQTITTPNAAIFSYALPPGGISGSFFPVPNQPVFVMGCQLQVGFRGVGQVTLLRIPASFLEWVGLESTAGAAITQGFSALAGTHIVFLDFSHQVDIEVASADSFNIHNTSTGFRSGIVTLIW
jgi:hypothetical protein